MYEQVLKIQTKSFFHINGASLFKDYKAWTYWKVIMENNLGFRVCMRII